MAVAGVAASGNLPGSFAGGSARSGILGASVPLKAVCDGMARVRVHGTVVPIG